VTVGIAFDDGQDVGAVRRIADSLEIVSKRAEPDERPSSETHE
jgi:hypothetical protein